MPFYQGRHWVDIGSGPWDRQGRPSEAQLRDEVVGSRLGDGPEILDRDHGLGRELGQLQGQRAAIVAAGPAANYIFAVLIFAEGNDRLVSGFERAVGDGPLRLLVVLASVGPRAARVQPPVRHAGHRRVPARRVEEHVNPVSERERR